MPNQYYMKHAVYNTVGPIPCQTVLHKYYMNHAVYNTVSPIPWQTTRAQVKYCGIIRMTSVYNRLCIAESIYTNIQLNNLVFGKELTF